MAKAKKNAKKVEVEVPAEVQAIRNVAEAAETCTLPPEQMNRFAPQLNRITKQLFNIAERLNKAINLEATKAEREAKKAEVTASRKKKIVDRIATLKAQLEKLEA